jgi:hypothetical protein
VEGSGVLLILKLMIPILISRMIRMEESDSRKEIRILIIISLRMIDINWR